jgi:hypothetical protein
MRANTPTPENPGGPENGADTDRSLESVPLPEKPPSERTADSLSGPADGERQLAAELIALAIRDGRAVAALPEGRRDEVITLMTRLMADPERLDGYCSALEAERRRRGPEVELKLIGMDGLDFPDGQIAAEGFVGLSDDQLADIALSPEALRALKETLDDPQTEPGPWFIDAVLEAEAARPDAAEQGRRAAEIYRRLRGEGTLS